MRLFQFGNRIINIDAVAHVHYAANDDRHYCQVFFNSNAAPLLLKGDLAIQFWVLTQHLATEISAREPAMQPQ